MVEMVFWKVFELHSRATKMLITSFKLCSGTIGGLSCRTFFASAAFDACGSSALVAAAELG